MMAGGLTDTLDLALLHTTCPHELHSGKWYG